jgi:hypothetical protein
MNKISIAVLFTLFASHQINAQLNIANAIPLPSVSQHVGETVTLCGKVYQASLLQNVIGKPTLMNMGGSNANERVEVRINFEDRAAFSFNPEVLFLNKNICFTGTITDVHGYTEIIVSRNNALKLFQEAAVTKPEPVTQQAANVVTSGETIVTRRPDTLRLVKQAYILTGPKWNEQVIAHLKEGSEIMVDYIESGWSYVRVINNSTDGYNSWVTGFIKNEAIGLDNKGRLIRKKQSKPAGIVSLQRKTASIEDLGTR